VAIAACPQKGTSATGLKYRTSSSSPVVAGVTNAVSENPTSCAMACIVAASRPECIWTLLGFGRRANLDQPPRDGGRQQRVSLRYHTYAGHELVGLVSLSRNPLAPARRASKTHSLTSKVVRMRMRVLPAGGVSPRGHPFEAGRACERHEVQDRSVASGCEFGEASAIYANAKPS